VTYVYAVYNQTWEGPETLEIFATRALAKNYIKARVKNEVWDACYLAARRWKVIAK